MTVSVLDIVLRLFLAALLGCVVGIERERKDWSAGMRTHMLVCLGSALATIISAFGFHDVLGTQNVVLDPSRIAAQVISGIGFLCAGTILFLRQEIVKGLTTAAGLWAVACIGLAIGAGLYVAGVTTTIIVILILAALKPLEKRLFRSKRNRHLLTIVVQHEGFVLAELDSVLRQILGNYISLTIIPHPDAGEDLLKIRLKAGTTTVQFANLLGKLRTVSGVRAVIRPGINQAEEPDS